MGTFLLILFIVFFVIPLFRVVLTVHKARNTMRDAMRGMYDAQQKGSAKEQAKERKAGWSSPVGRRKKIDKEVGEYVKFEEVSVTVEHDDNDSRSTTTTTYSEAQITDVEWEDIK